MEFKLAPRIISALQMEDVLDKKGKAHQELLNTVQRQQLEAVKTLFPSFLKEKLMIKEIDRM